MSTGAPSAADPGLLLPGQREPMDLAAAERLAGVLKALVEPTRLRLLSLVAAQPDGEACICDLTTPGRAVSADADRAQQGTRRSET